MKVGGSNRDLKIGGRTSGQQKSLDQNRSTSSVKGRKDFPLTPNSSVPVLVESLPQPSFDMVRCNYMTIECDRPLLGWQLTVAGQSMPFLMLGLVGIVQQPLGASLFDTYRSIEEFFELIEQKADLLITFDDIWLPSFLFRTRPNIGEAYRIQNNLFVSAYWYRDGQHNLREFEQLCNVSRNEIVFSEIETRAFRAWSTEQVSSATNRPPKNPDLQLRIRRENE